jgi:hypothetical protein
MARRPSDRNNPANSFADRRGFDPDEFWRDHPHLIRAIKGPHGRDASRLPFRRPIAVDDLEDLLESSDDPPPSDEPVLDIRDKALPVRRWSVPDEPEATDGPSEPAPGETKVETANVETAVEQQAGAVIDLTSRLPKRTSPPPVKRDRIPLVKRKPKVEPHTEWMDEVAEQQLDTEMDGFDAEALRFARRIRRARQRTVSPPLTEWDPPTA